ncbi:hypothetical protein [uncultured Maritalea sp.]|uniref:hypothetical protein n=1 Tax=uncultured Maritalea sp. TaxID=757249 RepID=UPI0026230BB0|nr:hypothetical protein [uncultured Maritalea sp.]
MVHPFGLVTYRFGKDDGTLIAEWVNDDPASTNSEIGIGLAKSSNAKSDSYEGDYKVEYWLQGKVIKLDLTIVASGEIFKMSWMKNGELTNTGYGFVSGDMLVAGFSR